MNNIFGYVFERATAKLNDFSIEVPSFLGGEVELMPNKERVEYKSRKGEVTIFTAVDKKIHISLAVGEVSVDAVLAAPQGELVLVSRVLEAGIKKNYTGVNVTRKLAGMKVMGTAKVAERTYNLDNQYAIVDDTHGLLAHETRWRWASAAGKSTTGSDSVWGINLVAGHNNYEYSENGIWRDGLLTYVGRTIFEFDANDPMKPWHIFTDDGAVDLTFTPEGMRAGDVDFKIMGSKYRAPLGSYSGMLLGEQVMGIPGMAEHHIAKW